MNLEYRCGTLIDIAAISSLFINNKDDVCTFLYTKSKKIIFSTLKSKHGIFFDMCVSSLYALFTNESV